MDYTIILPLCLVLILGLCVNFMVFYTNKRKNRLNGACHPSTRWGVEGKQSGSTSAEDVKKWIKS